MKPTIARTITAGLAAGAAFALVTFVTFVLIGSGLDHSSGPLFDPAVQSAKVIAVWTRLQPLPRFVTQPPLMLGGYLLFGVGHALLFRSVAGAWPEGVAARAWRLAAITWTFSYLFFEFFGPFNLLGEPPALVILELAFWAAAATAESIVLVVLLERGRRAGSEVTIGARGVQNA
jgi:hypothetical protein